MRQCKTGCSKSVRRKPSIYYDNVIVIFLLINKLESQNLNMIRRLINGFTYIFTLQWIEDGGRIVIYILTLGRVAARDTKSETIKNELNATKSFSAKFFVLLKVIFRVIIFTEIGLWFWLITLTLLALIYMLVFGSIKPVHQW